MSDPTREQDAAQSRETGAGAQDDPGSNPGVITSDSPTAERIRNYSRATGEPGQKQESAPADLRADADETVRVIDEAISRVQAETMGPSDERSRQPGNPHPVAPHERRRAPGPMLTAATDTAAGALAAARTAVTTQILTDERLRSDPRYERDQLVYEMGQAGTLGTVPPSEAEMAARAARTGLPQEVVEKLPTSPTEQVEEDMQRLDAARTTTGVNPTVESAESDRQRNKEGGDQSSTSGDNNGGTVIR